MLHIKKVSNLTILLTLISFSCNIFSSEMKMVWQDEFSVDGLPDKDKWTYETGYVRNGERQLYTKDDLKNARVESGYLIIEAHKEDYSKNKTAMEKQSGSLKKKDDYSSASITTEHLEGWKYGRVEVRAKLPQGRGVWPAIWLLGKDFKSVGWPATGEIDIMEYVGFQPNVIHAALHTTARNHNNNNAANGVVTIDDLDKAFHVYAVERRADRVDFWIDDNLYYSYKKEKDSLKWWPFDKPMYLILNLAIGGGWGGQKGIDLSIFPQQYIIDYVRIYEFNDSK